MDIEAFKVPEQIEIAKDCFSNFFMPFVSVVVSPDTVLCG